MHLNLKQRLAMVFLSWLSLLAFSTADVGAMAPELSVEYVEGMLSVKAQNVRLEDVLKQITQKTQLDLILTGPSQTLVTADFEAIALERGIKRLIRGLDSVFYYGYGDSGHKDLKLISVLILSNSDIHKTTVFRQSSDDRNPGQGSTAVPYAKLVEDIDQLTEEAREEDRAVYELAELAEFEENQERRLAAVEALGDVRNPEVETTLIYKALNDDDAEVRAAAVEALGSVSGEYATEFMVQALQDEDADVRTMAIETLAINGGEDKTDIIIGSMKDEDAEVRAAAVEALADIGDKRAAEVLIGALYDVDEEVQEYAQEALDKMGIKNRSPKEKTAAERI